MAAARRTPFESLTLEAGHRGERACISGSQGTIKIGDRVIGEVQFLQHSREED